MAADRLPPGDIAAVGTVVADRIVRPDGLEAEGLGGLVYGVAAMAAATAGHRGVRPVCRADAALRERLRATWGTLPGVSLDGVIVHEGPTTAVLLDYRVPGLAPGERVERLVNPVPPIDTGELLDATAGAAAVLVNMITGFDVSLEAFRSLPAGPLVMLDVHSLALGRRPDGTRYGRPVPGASAWLGGADIVQCNRFEAAMLTGVAPDEPVAVVAGRLAAAMRAAGRPHTAVLTLGTEGAALVPVGGEPIRRAVPCRVEGDPTGAGDTLGSAFLALLGRGLEPVPALEGAMAAAASACERSGAGPAWDDADETPAPPAT